jgi:aconitate decarboxylase
LFQKIILGVFMPHDITIANEHSKRVAEFVCELKFQDIPNEVLQRAKMLILDSFGCGIFGANLQWVNIIYETLKDIDTDQSHGIWGSDRKLSALNAALLNGTQVQGFELDDIHRRGVLHVGAVTLPPVIAVANMATNFTGKDFITSAIAGYEVGPRVGICMRPDHIGQGWHSGATVGTFSAAAGAARALGLDKEKTIHALGIAGTQAAGLMAAQYGAMVKRMHAGKSAQSGLLAALLAQRGFTGILDVFEAPYGGFCTTFSRSKDRFDLEELSRGLGESFELMNIALKFYSCVASNHTTLDALKDIQQRRPFSYNEVSEIKIWGSQVTVDHVGWPYTPQGLTSAQLNLPFCVATLLLEGDVSPKQFDESCVTDEKRIALSQKVHCIHDPEITSKGSHFRHMVHVEVIFNDGKTERQTREFQRGSEHDFADDQTIIKKFMTLTSERISTNQQNEIIDKIMNIEALPDIKKLTNLLVL